MGACLGVLALISGCAGTKASGSGPIRGSGGAGGSSSTPGAGSGGGIQFIPPADNVEAGPEAGVIENLPMGFTATDVGGFQLGEPLSGPNAGTVPDGNATCANVLLGVVRDFVGGTGAGQNPDFQGDLFGMMPTPGLVGPTLDASQKPTYTGKCEKGSMNASMSTVCPFFAETTSKAHFDQWYNYTEGVNLPFIIRFFFKPQANGLFTFQSSNFFPLDGAGFGNTPAPAHGLDGSLHNFSFTTELHTQFKFAGTETFTFTGDDDIWVFINGHLAVDLGGLHAPAMKIVDLAASAASLGLSVGSTYDLDLFHAERHDYESNFRIDTNLSFVNCGTVPEDVN